MDWRGKGGLQNFYEELVCLPFVCSAASDTIYEELWMVG